MLLSLSPEGLWELRSESTNELLFEIHNNDIPKDKEPKLYIMRLYDNYTKIF